MLEDFLSGHGTGASKRTAEDDSIDTRPTQRSKTSRSAAIDSVAQAHPRLPEEAKNNSAYAHRLNLLSRQGVATARLGDQPLTLRQLAAITGAHLDTLNRDPILLPLPEELAPIRAAHPRLQEEEKNDIAYARRLHELSRQGAATARAGDQVLSFRQLAALSGASEIALKRDPSLKPLPENLASVARAHPRLSEETSKAAYARRLYWLGQQGVASAQVQGRALSISQLAALSGAAKTALYEDPKLKPIPEALIPVMQAHPRLPEEGGTDIAYARRLNLISRQGVPTAQVGGAALTLEQLSALSGVPLRNLRPDPKLKPLPEALAPVALAHPRLTAETGKDLVYARRLNMLSQQGVETARLDGQALNISQLSALSGATESLLKKDPRLTPLPLELAAISGAQLQNLASDPQMKLSDSVGSGQMDPSGFGKEAGTSPSFSLVGRRTATDDLIDEWQPHRSETSRPGVGQSCMVESASLESVAQAHPRLPYEANVAYARRLHLLSRQGVSTASVNGQTLKFAHLAAISGASRIELSRNPDFNPLPEILATVARAHPRLPEESHNNSAYARRLYSLGQQGVASAQVQGQALSITQLAALSGAAKSDLKGDPKLTPMPEALVPVALAHPRLPDEKNKNSAYARRLNLLSRQGVPTARVGGAALTLEQLSALSGAALRNLTPDPKLQPLPVALAPVALAHPRLKPEAGKDLAYARRLNQLSQQGVATARLDGQALSIPQLSALSGAREGSLKRDAKLHPLPPELAPVARAHPRLDTELTNDMAYARRLNLLSRQGEIDARVDGMPLTLAQLAAISGAHFQNLARDPQLQPLPESLAPIALAHPRLPKELGSNLGYARRLHGLSQQGVATARVDGQALNAAQLAALSGKPEIYLERAFFVEGGKGD